MIKDCTVRCYCIPYRSTSTFHCKHELSSINHNTFLPSIISSKNICQQYTMSVGHQDTFSHSFPSNPSTHADNKFMEWKSLQSWSFSCFISWKEACFFLFLWKSIASICFGVFVQHKVQIGNGRWEAKSILIYFEKLTWRWLSYLRLFEMEFLG